MAELIYTVDGKTASKEEYIRKINLEGYEDVYEQLCEKNNQNHHVDEMYLIQLFNQNCQSCTSGVKKVFVEDIEDFSEHFLNVEIDEDRKERFLRSKAGEIVTDYYSADPNLNIVQKGKVTDFGWVMTWSKGKTLTVRNGSGYPSDYKWGLLILELRLIKYEGRYYKLVRPQGRDGAHKRYNGEWEKLYVHGNRLWIYGETSPVPEQSADFDAFRGTKLESYVWHIADVFDTKQEMLADWKRPYKCGLSEEQVTRVFMDLGGDVW